MKVLITGGLGFIGTALEDALIARGHTVTIFDRSRVNRENYIRGDICDIYSLKRAFETTKPDVVVHFAAMVSRKECEETPFTAIQTNVDGTLNVVLMALAYNSRLIYSGSSEEYGTSFSGGFVTEDTPFGHPTSIYSMTKRMSEEIIQYHADFKGLVATTIRFFMLYGPGEISSDYRSALIRFIDAAQHGKSLTVHQGTSRQWCYIDDAIDAVVRIVEREQCEKYEAFNIGSEDVISTEDLAYKILDMTVSQSKVNLIEVEETVIPIKHANFDRALHVLGWKATTDLTDGIQKVCQRTKGEFQ